MSRYTYRSGNFRAMQQHRGGMLTPTPEYRRTYLSRQEERVGTFGCEGVRNWIIWKDLREILSAMWEKR